MTATGAGSGWTGEYALPSSARRWVKEQTALMSSRLPFPLPGRDSGNGGEFINRQLLDWCRNNGVKFTRGRPCRKNGNCFVEQKNGGVVRKTVGYARFEGKTPCRRLLESPDLSDECKDELNRRAALLNPVELKHQLDQARGRLLKLSVIEPTIPSGKVS